MGKVKMLFLKSKQTIYEVAEWLNTKVKHITAITVGLCVSAMTVTPALADVTINTGGLDTYFGGVVELIYVIARFVGIALSIVAVVKVIMAYKDEQPDRITSNIKFLIIGIVLIFIKPMTSWLFNAKDDASAL